MRTTNEESARSESRDARATLVSANIAHALHDGFTDLIYVLLPIFQNEFALGYAALAALRGLYAGAMSTCQIAAGYCASKIGGKAVLIIGTFLASLGYAVAGLSNSLAILLMSFIVCGVGASTQHPIASAAVARAYGAAARGPLSTYNFSGDLGKAIMPAAVSVFLTLAPWRAVVEGVAVIGLLVSFFVWRHMPSKFSRPLHATVEQGQGKRGFFFLLAIGIIDNAVRVAFLTFLPFMLKSKGADLPMVGLAISLVFVGGAFGKMFCGQLANKAGVSNMVLLTEAGTAIAIMIELLLPLIASLIVLPVVGALLNGTSSVLYGTVPEFSPRGKSEHTFAVFYTGISGAGAIAPACFGLLGDQIGLTWAVISIALTTLFIFPFVFLLSPHLNSS